MSDIKTNLRDGAYVALGAAALGVSHLTKRTDEMKIHLNTMSSKFEPVIKDVTPKINEARILVTDTLTPFTQIISPVTNKVSTNISPLANNVVSHVKDYAQTAITSSRKIAQEAKRRVQ